MSNPFFLTRQTANLMEDFTRELNAGSALFLLYGDPQVGKTRLLQELMQNRLADKQLHWIDLAKIEDDDNLSDRSREIEAIFESAGHGDIIVADHFEEALKKPRHQLFQSWSTDGLDKKLNLIISSSTEGFNELRQLSMQYQVRVQSFQQMPYSQDEVEAFLGFYLFPDHPIGQLSIPSPLRKQLASTNGIIGRVLELAQRDGSLIASSPMTETESIRRGSWIIVCVLSLAAIVAGVGWYLNNQPGDTVAISEPQSTSVAASSGSTGATTTPVVEESSEGLESEPPVVEGAKPGPETLPQSLAAESSAGGETGTADLPADPMPRPDVNPDEPVSASDASVATAISQSTTAFSPRFEAELNESLDWLYTSKDSDGTIQLMSLGLDPFDETAFYQYIDGLERSGVDTDQIRVFKTLIGDKPAYSVVYGFYDSRQAAAVAINKLPKVLRKAAPIPRSTGGIRDEIRRLITEN